MQILYDSLCRVRTYNNSAKLNWAHLLSLSILSDTGDATK